MLVLLGVKLGCFNPNDRGNDMIYKTKELKAALTFCKGAMAKNDVRYYLKGVYFQKDKGEPLYLVATDGHRLNKVAVGEADTQEFSFILEDRDVRTLLKVMDSREYITLTESTFIIGNITLACAPINGTYPKYQKMIDDVPDRKGRLLGFNAGYLVEAFKAFDALHHGGHVTSHGSGKEGEPVMFKLKGRDATILLMPLRS